MVELGDSSLQRVVAEVVTALYSEVPDNPALEGMLPTMNEVFVCLLIVRDEFECAPEKGSADLKCT